VPWKENCPFVKCPENQVFFLAPYLSVFDFLILWNTTELLYMLTADAIMIVIFIHNLAVSGSL